jgi:hypothetical protein
MRPIIKKPDFAEDLIHKSALMLHLLMDVLSRRNHQEIDINPLDLSIRQVGKLIFPKSIAKNRGKLKTHHTDNEVTNILMLLSNSMVLRLELVLRLLAFHVREAVKGKKELPEVARYIKRINKLIIRGMYIANHLVDFGEYNWLHS